MKVLDTNRHYSSGLAYVTFLFNDWLNCFGKVSPPHPLVPWRPRILHLQIFRGTVGGL